MFPIETYRETADFLRARTHDFDPEVLLVLGSGLGYLAQQCADAVTVPYEEIPHFTRSTVAGHAGALTFGTLAGRRVLLMQGRMHMYEGNSPEQSAFAIGVAKLLGARTVLLTNASGGINLDFHEGDIMLVRDHINLFSATPLWGANCEELGTRFPDMTRAYTPRLQDIARAAAHDEGVILREGVYFYAPGPQYETPAEIRAMRVLGGDAVGMSTVNETIAAAHCGMELLCLSLITDMAAGIKQCVITHDEVMDIAARAQDIMTRLVVRVVATL
ncbi:MAG: purine-nucleoside phosphorylase [Clostridia bacterium]|nr:purine-nucleoside phosphorylase [Clostridia bacterium]